MKRIKQLHLYLGLFLAPSVIFFAFSGALQIFRLQDSKPGSTYQPPSWIVALAGVHKDQRFETQRPARPAPPAGEAAAAPRPAAPASQPPVNRPSTALKWFFLLEAIGVITTTILGIMMAFKYNRGRRLIWGLLALGIILPIALLFL